MRDLANLNPQIFSSEQFSQGSLTNLPSAIPLLWFRPKAALPSELLRDKGEIHLTCDPTGPMSFDLHYPHCDSVQLMFGQTRFCCASVFSESGQTNLLLSTQRNESKSFCVIISCAPERIFCPKERRREILTVLVPRFSTRHLSTALSPGPTVTFLGVGLKVGLYMPWSRWFTLLPCVPISWPPAAKKQQKELRILTENINYFQWRLDCSLKRTIKGHSKGKDECRHWISCFRSCRGHCGERYGACKQLCSWNSSSGRVINVCLFAGTTTKGCNFLINKHYTQATEVICI